MLRSILIGLDGSAYSNAAIDLGIRWARRFDAMLVGLGVVDKPTICALEPVPIGASYYKRSRDESLLADARCRVGEFLGQFGRRCSAEGVKWNVIEDTGDPLVQVVRASKLCDLIMLGQKTYFHFETQDYPDEASQTVLRRSSRPVVMVPGNLKDGTGTVVAYDGSPEADRALQAFQALGLAGNDEVHVVSIHAVRAVAERVAEQAANFLKLHDLKAVTCPHTSTAYADSIILAEAQRLRPELIVMGACGHSRLREFIFGSITMNVLKASPVPLFLCH